MTEVETSNDAPPDTGREAARAALLQRLEDLTADEGHFEGLGARHWALFEDVGTTLIVTFDQLDTIVASEAGMPLPKIGVGRICA